MTWPERAQSDVSLRAFVQAEVARAGVALQALQVEHQHLTEIITALKDRIAELERERTTKKKAKGA